MPERCGWESDQGRELVGVERLQCAYVIESLHNLVILQISKVKLREAQGFPQL